MNRKFCYNFIFRYYVNNLEKKINSLNNSDSLVMINEKRTRGAFILHLSGLRFHDNN